MHMTYFWRCTSPVTGRRYTIRWRMTEDEARARLTDPERVEYGALAIEPDAVVGGHAMPSGLVRRDDGAMLAPDTTASACPAPPTRPSQP
jgi:hypothetical protein